MRNVDFGINVVFKNRDEFVADKLREAIIKSQIKPGERLDQNEIAAILKVSRSPVREAIRTLTAEGLVEIYPHKGAVVVELSQEEFEEVYFLRMILEGAAVRLAAQIIDSKCLDTLKMILEYLDKPVSSEEWIKLNSEFHNTIYQAIQRPRLLSIITNLRNAAAPYITQYIASSEYRKEAQEDHKRIYEACQNHDGETAQKETEMHLLTVSDFVSKGITKIRSIELESGSPKHEIHLKNQ